MILNENYSMGTAGIELKKEIFPGASTVVDGEIQQGIWLLYGPPKVGKAAFCVRFACDRILEERECVYVLTNSSPAELITEILAAEPELESRVEEYLKIIDCYSWRFGKTGGEYQLSNASDLSQLSILIRKAVESLKSPSNGFGVAIDTISTLALEAGPAATVDFLQIQIARMKELNCFGVCSLAEGVHQEPFANTLKVIFNGVFEMRHIEKEEGLRRAFRIFYLPRVHYSTDWLEYELTPRGIEFPSMNYL